MKNQMRFFVLAVCIAASPFSPAVHSAQAGDPDAVRTHAVAMYKSVKIMAGSAANHQLGDIPTVGQSAIVHGETAIAAVPHPGNQHARDTIEHLSAAIVFVKAAIQHAEEGDEDALRKSLRKALAQLRRGRSHAEAL